MVTPPIFLQACELLSCLAFEEWVGTEIETSKERRVEEKSDWCGTENTIP